MSGSVTSPGGEHLDLLRIDAIRAEEGSPEERAHLEDCPQCRGVLGVLREAASTLEKSTPGPPQVPPSVDRTILGRFRRGGDPVIFFPRWLIPALGTAAAAAFAMVFVIQRAQQPKPQAPSPSAMRVSTHMEGDINRDGRVDILDALRLAQILRDTGDEPEWADTNHDGRVNLIDVDDIARRSVAL